MKYWFLTTCVELLNISSTNLMWVSILFRFWWYSYLDFSSFWLLICNLSRVLLQMIIPSKMIGFSLRFPPCSLVYLEAHSHGSLATVTDYEQVICLIAGSWHQAWEGQESQWTLSFFIPLNSTSNQERRRNGREYWGIIWAFWDKKRRESRENPEFHLISWFERKLENLSPSLKIEFFLVMIWKLNFFLSWFEIWAKLELFWNLPFTPHSRIPKYSRVW